jgi:hypothetical protein
VIFIYYEISFRRKRSSYFKYIYDIHPITPTTNVETLEEHHKKFPGSTISLKNRFVGSCKNNKKTKKFSNPSNFAWVHEIFILK